VASILIAGCGYVGATVADLFSAAGWEVEGWTASSGSAAALADKNYKVRAVDITNADEIAATPRTFDAVIHCASTRGGQAEDYQRVYLEGARHLLDRFAKAAFLFTSSTSVYAQKNGEWVTEQSEAEPEHETGRILREAERLVLARGGCVARLAGIYGPSRSALLRRVLEGEAVIDEESERYVNQIHRDDAAAAIAFLVKEEVARGQVYNVVDDQPVLQSECYRWLTRTLGRPLSLVPPGSARRKRGRSNKRVSNATLRALGWAPAYPSFIEGMKKSVLPKLGELPPA
jgi:nucleoside-diphosphate-sugar epimerase